MRYVYYPGCSLKATGKPYEESLLAVFRELGLQVDELADWSCCGATTYMGVDEMQAFALATRNLALAERVDPSGHATLMTPCNACYLVLNKAKQYVADYPEVNERVSGALLAIDLDYRGDVAVRHPLDILLNDVGLETIRKHIKIPLSGLKVACYYGCQIVRPYATFDDQYQPQSMDRLLRAIGAETVDWPLRTRCCGGALIGTNASAGLGLNCLLLEEARRLGAQAIATCCPLCQHNLECYQQEIGNEFGVNAEISVAYFTQLLGVALGLHPDALGMQRMLTPVRQTVQPSERRFA